MPDLRDLDIEDALRRLGADLEFPPTPDFDVPSGDEQGDVQPHRHASEAWRATVRRLVAVAAAIAVAAAGIGFAAWAFSRHASAPGGRHPTPVSPSPQPSVSIAPVPSDLPPV